MAGWGWGHFAVLFEAKVLSDVSGSIEFDVLRNQIIRNVDVMLEDNSHMPNLLKERLPGRTCFVLITPEVFRNHPGRQLAEGDGGGRLLDVAAPAFDSSSSTAGSACAVPAGLAIAQSLGARSCPT